MSPELQGVLWGVGLLVPILGASAWMLWRHWTWQGIPWAPLPGTGFKYRTDQADPVVLKAAARIALACVEVNTGWHDVETKLDGWAINVHDTPIWWDDFRRHVAGETWVYGVSEVGSDFKALAHELCHAYLMRTGQPTLADHEEPAVKARWEELGCGKAERAFVAQLGGGA